MKPRTIGVLGGTGFVGHHLLARLGEEGHTLRVLTRRPHRHRELSVLPTLRLIEADVHDPEQLRRHFAGCDTVINLVGILNEKGHKGEGFRQVHAELPRKVVQACMETGVGRLLHMSALNADLASAPSHYLRSKAEGEDHVMKFSGDRIQATAFRPSVVFGPGDSFLNRFARLLAVTPLVFPLACPDTRFAPVYVGDVVDAFADALRDPDTWGQRYDLCGPREYTLKALVQYCARVTGRRRWIMGLPDWASRMQAAVLEYFPGKPFSRDNYLSLMVDSVCPGGGCCPTSLEAMAPMYLAHRNYQAQVQALRKTRWEASATSGGTE